MRAFKEEYKQVSDFFMKAPDHCHICGCDNHNYNVLFVLEARNPKFVAYQKEMNEHPEILNSGMTGGAGPSTTTQIKFTAMDNRVIVKFILCTKCNEIYAVYGNKYTDFLEGNQRVEAVLSDIEKNNERLINASDQYIDRLLDKLVNDRLY